MRLNSIYLNFAGNAEEVFLFYKSVFNCEFDSLSAGGHVEMAMADMPWGDYFGSFKDKFDIQWMLSVPNKK